MSVEPKIEVVGDRLVRIASEFGGRWLHQFVVGGDNEYALIDAGDLGVGENVIVPALARLGIGAGELKLIVVTHTDVDHQGGVAPVRAAYPGAVLACGFEDRPLVEDPALMISARYDLHRTAHGMGFPVDVRPACGPPLTVDVPLLGGETFEISGQELHVHHAPGHTAGHLVVELPGSGDLVMGDAVHGRHSSALDGHPAIPPTYEEIDPYLATIGAVRSLTPRRLHSGHEPTLEGAALEDFLTDSEGFVTDLEAALAERLNEPATLAELCEHALDRFGPFDTPAFYFVFAVHGHVRHRARRGLVEVVDPLARPFVFRKSRSSAAAGR